MLFQANDMLLAGRKLTALEAHQAGLVSQVLWHSKLMEEVMPRLQQMAQASAKVCIPLFMAEVTIVTSVILFSL